MSGLLSADHFHNLNIIQLEPREQFLQQIYPSLPLRTPSKFWELDGNSVLGSPLSFDDFPSDAATLHECGQRKFSFSHCRARSIQSVEAFSKLEDIVVPRLCDFQETARQHWIIQKTTVTGQRHTELPNSL